MAVDWKSVGKEALKFGVDFGKSMLTSGADLGVSFLGGMIDDHFNEKSEKRADERNRSLIRDTSKLQMLGLGDAGLNPYHLQGASMPGLSAQSQTDTSLRGEPFLNKMLSIENTEADIEYKRALANESNANADRLRGTERRDEELHGFNKRLKEQEIELNEYGIESVAIDNFIKANTADDMIAMTKQELNNLVKEGELLIEQIANSSMDTAKKAAEIDDIYSQIAAREVQARLAEAQIELTLAEVEQVFANISLISAQELVALSENQINLEQANMLIAQTKGIEIENDLNKRYGGAQRVVGMVTDSLDSLSNVAGAVADFLPWNALKNKNASLSKQVKEANSRSEQQYEHGYRDGAQSRTSGYPQYRKYNTK